MSVPPPDPADYQRLLQQERRLNHVAQAIDLGMWFCDLPFDELHWNDAVRDHFWVDRHARVTIDVFYERIHPDDREQVRTAINTSIAAHTLYDTEMRTWNPRDITDCKWVRAVGWTSYDDQDNPTRFDGVTFDITQEHQQRDTIERNETRLTLALQAAKMGFWEWDIATDEIMLSDQLCEDWGIDPALFGGSLAEAVSRIHADDRGFVETAIRQNLASGQPYHLEYRVVHPGGVTVWIRANGRTVREKDGRTVRAVGTSVNITESKRQEEFLLERERQFRTLADSLPVLVWIADPQFKVTYTNERWRTFFGGPVGYHFEWHDLLHPDDLERTLLSSQEARAHNTSYAVEHRLRAASGDYVWHLTRGVPIADRQGHVYQWFGTCTDIHLQREAAASLQQAVTVRDEFLSIASHELKTPLSSLILQTQMWRRRLTKDDPRASDRQRLLQTAEQNAGQLARLTRLVDDMLDVARIRSGRLSMERAPMDLAALANECVERMRPQFGDRLAYEGEAEIEGEWDRVRLDQVLTNLLSNALRYGRGQPVRVMLRRLSNCVELSVHDHGTGIEPTALARIFNRFERAVSKSEVSGLGLGLFISQEIVAAHGGRIEVQSNVGVGSTFTVTLPLRSSES